MCLLSSKEERDMNFKSGPFSSKPSTSPRLHVDPFQMQYLSRVWTFRKEFSRTQEIRNTTTLMDVYDKK